MRREGSVVRLSGKSLFLCSGLPVCLPKDFANVMRLGATANCPYVSELATELWSRNAICNCNCLFVYLDDRLRRICAILFAQNDVYFSIRGDCAGKNEFSLRGGCTGHPGPMLVLYAHLESFCQRVLPRLMIVLLHQSP